MLGYSSNTLTRVHLGVLLCMVLLMQLVLEVDSMNGIEKREVGEEEVGEEGHLIHDAYADEEVLSFAEDEDEMPLDERIETRHTTPFVRVTFALFDPACSLAGCDAQTQALNRPILMSHDLQDALQPQAERKKPADYDSNSDPDHGTLVAATTEKGTKLVHMRVGSTQYILCSLINEKSYALRVAHAYFSAKSFSSSDDGIPYDMPEVKLDRFIPSGEETSFMLKLSLPEHRVGIRANLAISLIVKGVRAEDAYSEAIDLMHIDLITVQQNDYSDEYRAAAGLLSFLLSACALFLVFRESSSR